MNPIEKLNSDNEAGFGDERAELVGVLGISPTSTDEEIEEARVKITKSLGISADSNAEAIRKELEISLDEAVQGLSEVGEDADETFANAITALGKDRPKPSNSTKRIVK